MSHPMPHGAMLDANFMFTKLVVADLDTAAAFYTSVFGFVEMHRVEAAIDGRAVSEIIYMPTSEGGPMFILAKFLDSNMPATGETLLGFGVGDLDGLIARAVKAGGALKQRIDAQPGVPFHTAFLTDPEGHAVQVSQPVD